MDAYELAVADALTREGYDVFVPHKDRGVDLVALRPGDNQATRLQVKGSRTYGNVFMGWFKFDWRHLQASAEMTDFWVFVCLAPSSRGVFRPQFAVIPTGQLVSRLGCYHKADPINFYLTEHRLDGGRALVDDRGFKSQVLTLKPNHPRVYTEFWSEAREDKRGIWRDLENQSGRSRRLRGSSAPK
jgi:hypothetical protein